jgi:hypothetical protein
LIKINQNTDFLSSSSSNGIENLEQKNLFVPLDTSENKIFSDLNLFSFGNIPQLNNHEINSNPNDSSFNSDDDISSKKSEIEIDFISKNGYQKFEQKNDINKLFQNDISFPFMNKYDGIKGPIEHAPISIDKNEECNLNDNSKEKITEKKEIENENELTNQNSGIFYNIHKKKFAKFHKKIKFLVLPNQKNNFKKDDKIEKYLSISDAQKFNEKNNVKKYKYKCEHPGCKKTFKTLKLKLNRHDLSELECKKDTITLLYMINNVKKLLRVKKRKNITRINRLKKHYKKCIINLAHKDYAINIAGSNLIN